MTIVKREIMWMLHNVVAHPLSEVCYWLGFVCKPARAVGNWLHDVTIPPHEKGTGRG